MNFKTLFTAILLCQINFSSVNAQNNTKVLEALGSTTAIALYNTYNTIDSFADCLNSKAYDAEYVTSMMNDQANLIDVLTASLQVCIDDTSEGKLSEQDKIYLKKLIPALNYLKKEAQALAIYSQTNSDENLEDYASNREKAWEMIAEVLGLE